jgi:hypothetical protein
MLRRLEFHTFPMTDRSFSLASSWKSKGIDISAAKAKKKKKPDQEPCEWAGCENMGGCKAPKSPDRLREYHNFCQAHAREYNKNWNFFQGMSDADITEWQVGARHGHRPTWDVRKNTAERAQANKRRKAGATAATAEGYTIFGDGGDPGSADSMPRRKVVSKMALKALHDLGLDEGATQDEVRKRYTKLVKQFHPDANQGSRDAEESFQRVLKAWKILKNANLG